MLLALLFVVFFALLALRVPVGVSLGLSALLLIFIQGMNPINIVTQTYLGLNSFALMAIPFFLVVGMILAHTSLAYRILDLADLIVGKVRGGLGYANVVSSMLMGGVSGSATADVASLGSVMIPMMRKRGYSAEYAAAVTAAASTMGLILPPSLVMIVYGAFVDTSIGALFLAGIVPGIVMGLSMLAVNFVHVRRHRIDHVQSDALLDEAASMDAVPVVAPAEAVSASGSEPSATRTGRNVSAGAAVFLPRLMRAFRQEERTVTGDSRRWYAIVARGIPTLLVPVIIVLGVRGGVFTATEAGAMALVYLLILVFVVYRELTWRRAKLISTQAILLYSQTLFAIAASGVFGWVLSLLGAANVVRDLMASVDFTPATYLVMVVIIFTVIGTFLDATPAVIIFAPLFSAGAVQLGIHPVHLGLIVVMVLGVGMITPPYGLSILLASRLAGVTLWGATKAVVPFWLGCYSVIFVFALSETAALYVPRLLAPALF